MRRKLGSTRITLLIAMLASPASASICSHRPISATGTAGMFTFLAQSHAKAAWRAAVTSADGLGPDYAAWGIAEDRKFECRDLPSPTTILGEKICTATASPCKFD